MAAKDADLAYDYAAPRLTLVDQDVAELTLVVDDQDDLPTDFEELFLVELGVGGAGATYRMRAHDTTLARYVFWNSSSIDPIGANYGGPGPLTDIVVQNVIGAD